MGRYKGDEKNYKKFNPSINVFLKLSAQNLTRNQLRCNIR